MIATALVPLTIVGLFVVAIALPNRLSSAIARAVAGVAVAVQVVALVLFLALSAADYATPVLLWIAVGWIVLPLGVTLVGLAVSFANPPRVVALWAVSLALFAISLPIILNIGAWVAPSALLMFIASIFALGPLFNGNPALERTNG